MVTTESLRKEAAAIKKALATNKNPEYRAQMEKLNFYCEKLIELSRKPDLAEQARINREIEEFNAKHPPSADDIIRLEPFKELFGE